MIQPVLVTEEMHTGCTVGFIEHYLDRASSSVTPCEKAPITPQ
jgi:hypothetical protein